MKKINDILCKILTKTILEVGVDWETKLFAALWTYHTVYKVTTNSTSFKLIYEQEVLLSIELEVQCLRISVDEQLSDKESMYYRLPKLEELDEI